MVYWYLNIVIISAKGFKDVIFFSPRWTSKWVAAPKNSRDKLCSLPAPEEGKAVAWDGGVEDRSNSGVKVSVRADC